jgi:hypothetical protein
VAEVAEVTLHQVELLALVVEEEAPTLELTQPRGKTTLAEAAEAVALLLALLAVQALLLSDTRFNRPIQQGRQHGKEQQRNTYQGQKGNAVLQL